MPLAHLLVPQIAKRAKELDQQIAPRTGVDQAWQGYLQTPGRDPVVTVQRTPGAPPEMQLNVPGRAPGVGRAVADSGAAAPPEWQGAQGGPIATPRNQGRLYPQTDTPGPWTEMAPKRDGNVRLDGQSAHLGGYLTIGNKGANAKKEPELYDPRDQSPAVSANIAAGTMMNSPNPVVRATGGGFFRNGPGAIGGMVAQPQILQNPAPPTPVEQQWASGRGGRGRVVFVDPGSPSGIAENGQAVDERGRKLGYLDQEHGTNTRYLDRRASDLIDDTPGNIVRDPFARKQLDFSYGDHLKAMEANRDENGRPTDKLPADYFKALGEQRGKPLTKAEKQGVLDGIKKLREVQKLEATDTGAGIPVARI